MRYALLISEDENVVINAEDRTARAAAFSAFLEEMQARGALLGSEQLEPAAAATKVQVWGGDVMITDGLDTRGREQVTSFCLIDCKDLDEAVRVATRVPAAWYGTVEVRPVRQT
jgi:hypothetical protein